MSTEITNSMERWTLEVAAIQSEAGDTKTIYFRRADNKPFPYLAGQFLTLLFLSHDRELRRSYSFCTTPDTDPAPGITVKRVPNGEISRHLLDHLAVGDTLISLPPAGRFLLDDTAGIHFFVAAGSGIVPVFSLLKQALSQHSDPRIILLSQFHDPGSAPFYERLQSLAVKHGPDRFRWVDLLTIRNGRLNNWWLEQWLFDLLPPDAFPATRFYICGPPAFMRMAQFTLRTLGIAEGHIKKEHFTVEHIPSAPPVFDRTPRKITIHDGHGSHAFEVKWPDTILAAGLRQGIPLPYSCRAGRCSTCVARCVKGKVRMTVNEVLTDNDLRAGLILTCVGYAETDVELSFIIPTPPA
jgi:ring-1,2-phenylacetyl-CoA epoxidase subunit PaaE